MYIDYLDDRKKLGFNSITYAVKELSEFKNTLKNPVTWIITKVKKTVDLATNKLIANTLSSIP